MEKMEKLCLYGIFVLIAFSLVLPFAVDSNFFFAFVSTKVFFFRITVLLLLGLYLVLVIINKAYAPKVNAAFLVFTAFTAWAFVSSYFGKNFYLSFWGDVERGEGLILYLHLLVYFLVLISVIREKKWWDNLVDFSLVISWILSLFALAQYFNTESILRSSSDRVDSTFGNPAYFATYLLFHIAFAVYFFVKKKNMLLRVYYAVSVLAFTFLLIQTKTRGAFVGFVAGALVSVLLYIFKKQGSKRGRQIALSGIGLAVLFFIFLYINKNSEWILQYPALNRIATISSQERTAQTRLATWGSSWEGWKENFVLGVGLENFNLVFDKYFPAVIYEDEGDRIWFDRAHNFVFDRGVTTGIVGLGLFSLFLVLPMFILWSRQNRKETHLGRIKSFFVDMKTQEEDNEEWFIVVFTGFIIGYIVQNLFIFESIGIYIIFIFTWAYFSSFGKQYSFKNLPIRKISVLFFILYAVVFWPVLNLASIKPARANIAAARAQILATDLDEDNFFEVVDLFQNAIEPDTYGTPEYSVRLVEYIDQILANKGAVVKEVIPALRYSDEVVERLIQLRPLDTKSYLLAMRHYNATFPSLPDERFDRLNNALSYFPELKKVGPKRAHVYYEAGFTNLYLYRNYKQFGPEEEAEKSAKMAEDFFLQAIEKSPTVKEAYFNLVMLYINVGEEDKVFELEEKLNGVAFYDDRGYLGRIIDLANANSRYSLLAYFTEKLVAKEPDNFHAMTQIALAYAKLGERAKAIEWANMVAKSDDPAYQGQAEKFIKDVNSGKYDQ